MRSSNRDSSPFTSGTSRSIRCCNDSSFVHRALALAKKAIGYRLTPLRRCRRPRGSDEGRADPPQPLVERGEVHRDRKHRGQLRGRRRLGVHPRRRHRPRDTGSDARNDLRTVRSARERSPLPARRKARVSASAISRELARGMGGDVITEPRPVGARFVLTLPRSPSVPPSS